MCDINTHLFCAKMLAVFRKRNLLQIQANMTGESDYMVYRPTWWNKWMELLAFLVQIQAKFESWILKHYEWAGMKHFHSSPHECAKCFHQINEANSLYYHQCFEKTWKDNGAQLIKYHTNKLTKQNIPITSSLTVNKLQIKKPFQMQLTIIFFNISPNPT